MKKLVAFLCLVLVVANSAVYADVYNSNYIQSGVVSLELMPYAKFYSIDSANVTVRYIEPSKDKQKQFSSEDKKLFKQIKKIEKYVAKKDFRKALEVEPNFLPTHVEYLNYCLKAGDYAEALSEMLVIQRLNKSDKVFDSEKLEFKLGMLYYLNKNYQVALNMLKPFLNKPNPENLWFALSDIYYNLSDYKSSILYAAKIQPNSENYPGALELLYNSYYKLQNFKLANKYAAELIKIYPSAINYMRLGTTSADSKTKLLNYYKARNISVAEKNLNTLAQADARIIAMEQPKIDRSVSGLSLFVEKPDWNKIAKENSTISDPVALSNRMVKFFQDTNACIAKFGDRELVKCFEAVNKEQVKLTNEAKAEYQRAYEAKQKELEYQRQIMLIEQQRYYNRWYYNDFFYLRHPYFFGFW